MNKIRKTDHGIPSAQCMICTRLFFLPGHCPERDPGEQMRYEPRNDGLGREVLVDPGELKSRNAVPCADPSGNLREFAHS